MFVESMPCPARVTIAGLHNQQAMACEAAKIQVVGSERDFLMGIIIHDRRGGKTFVAWERIVTIECIKEEPA